MKINQLKAGAVLSYVSIGITLFISLLYTPIMLRLLGQSEFGLYSLIGSIVAYLSILDMGLGNAIVRYTAMNRTLGDKNRESNLNGLFLILYSIIGALTIIIGALLYLNIENVFETNLSNIELEKAKIMMLLLIFNFAFSFPLGIFSSIIQAYEKFVFIKVLSIIKSIITPCIILPYLYWGYGSISMVVINTVVNLIFLLINMNYCFRQLKIKIYFGKFDFPIFREIAGYSFYIFLGVIVDKLYWNTGQIVLGVLSGTTVVAVYAIAMQLITLYMTLSTSVSGVLFPKISMMVANNVSNTILTNFMIKIGRLQFIIISYMVCGFILFGEYFIKSWAGPTYSKAYIVVLIIMIPLTIPLVQNIGIAILQAKNLHGFRSIVYIIIAVFNLIISIPTSKMWGLYGCAITTGVSIIIGNVIIMNIYYHRKVGLNMVLFWMNILKMFVPVIIAMLCGFIINIIVEVDNIYSLLLNVIMFSTIFIITMWLLVFNDHEKKYVINPLKKISNKLL